jgi:preprotein translocase subunit SecA
MGQIEDDFVRYVFHLQVVVDEQPEEKLRNVRYSAAESPSDGAGGMRAAAAAEPEALPAPAPAAAGVTAATGTQGGAAPVRQVETVRVEKTPGRNEPCFCGSGKKYKLCHGR